MATDSGFSNQKKKGIAQFETVQNLGSSKFGKSVAPKSVFEKTPAQAIVLVSDILGSNGQVEFWDIELTAHGALVGDVLRIDDAALKNFEFEIMEILGVDNLKVLPISDVKPAIGMNAIVMGWVTSRLDSTGSVILASEPIKFVLDGVDTEVLEDTVTPANNRPLPVKDIDGNALLTSIDAELVTLNAKDFATETTLASVDAELVTLNAKDFATETTLNSLLTKLPKSLVAGVEFDQIVTTYVGATTDIATVVYKNSGATVATLTLSYDGSNRLVDVLRT